MKKLDIVIKIINLLSAFSFILFSILYVYFYDYVFDKLSENAPICRYTFIFAGIVLFISFIFYKNKRKWLSMLFAIPATIFSSFLLLISIYQVKVHFDLYRYQAATVYVCNKIPEKDRENLSSYSNYGKEIYSELKKLTGSNFYFHCDKNGEHTAEMYVPFSFFYIWVYSYSNGKFYIKD